MEENGRKLRIEEKSKWIFHKIWFFWDFLRNFVFLRRESSGSREKADQNRSVPGIFAGSSHRWFEGKWGGGKEENSETGERFYAVCEWEEEKIGSGESQGVE